MSSSPDDDDALMEGMGPLPQESMIWPAVAPGMHDRILGETLVALRGRRRRWQAVRVAAFILVFLGGAVSGRFAWVDREGEQNAPRDSEPFEAEALIGDDPAVLEIRAEHPATADAAHLLRRAGDLFLVERMDIRAATRCYGRYLRLTPQDRAAQLDDTWLLASLKRTF
jgi:hypothetical protein